MKRIRLSKAGMLCNNKEFRRDCNELRKLINTYNTLDVKWDITKINDYAYDISVQCEVMMDKYKVSLRTLMDVVRSSSATIRKITVDYPIKKRNTRAKSSYLVDRVHYARLIIDGLKTYREVAEQTGYHYQTVWHWVKDYKLYGNGMIDNAIAFKRTLIVGA